MLTNQVSVLSFGSATVGLLDAAGATLWDTEGLIAGMLLLVVVPLVCFLTMVVYSAELTRLFRAGLFRNDFEEWISKSYTRAATDTAREQPTQLLGVLNWERWIGSRAKPHDIDQSNRAAVRLVFLTMAIGSATIGFVRLHMESSLAEPIVVALFVGSCLAAWRSILWIKDLTEYAYGHRKLCAEGQPERRVHVETQAPPRA